MKFEMTKIASLALLAACSSIPAQGVGMPASGAAQPQSIVVEPQSIICASVTVPQEIWPDRLEKNDGTGLSAWLVNSLRKRFAEVGKLGKATRFRTHDNDLDPNCNAPSTIYIDIHYKHEGYKKLSYNVEVKFMNVKRYFDGKIDVDEEIRSGRTLITVGESDTKKVIFKQVRETANSIFDSALVVK